MRYTDEVRTVACVVYNGRNMNEVKALVKEYSLTSMLCIDHNDMDKEYLTTAMPYGEAMEEYPEIGDVYAVDPDTQEIWLYTASEFEACFRMV